MEEARDQAVRKKSRNEEDLAPMSPIAKGIRLTKFSSHMVEFKAVVPPRFTSPLPLLRSCLFNEALDRIGMNLPL